MAYQAKDAQTLGQQLKIQEVVVRAEDKTMYVMDSSDVVVLIREPVESVTLCIKHDNSTPGLSTTAMADLVVCDSTTYAPGGDRCAIRVDTAAALDANDRLVIKYIAQE